MILNYQKLSLPNEKKSVLRVGYLIQITLCDEVAIPLLPLPSFSANVKRLWKDWEANHIGGINEIIMNQT